MLTPTANTNAKLCHVSFDVDASMRLFDFEMTFRYSCRLSVINRWFGGNGKIIIDIVENQYRTILLEDKNAQKLADIVTLLLKYDCGLAGKRSDTEFDV
jgi:hypothetical protein